MNKWEKLYNTYIKNDLKIFPVVSNGKTPLIASWNKDCSCDYYQVLYWYMNAENCNWGLPCIENDLFVIDLDVHDESKNGVENFYKLVNTLGITEEAFDTLTQQTPSNGIHLIYKTDEELKQVKGVANAFPDYPGIDLRNSNYIVVEPSTINNKNYKFVNNCKPKEMPVKLKEYILGNCEKKGKEKVPYVKPKLVEEGSRDEQLFAYINNLYFKTRLDYDEINILAHYFNEEILEEPLDDKVVDYKVKKVFEKKRYEYIHITFKED